MAKTAKKTRKGSIQGMTEAFQQVDKDSLNEGLQNTGANMGGKRWNPDPGDYLVRIIEGSSVRVVDTRGGKAPLFLINVEITGVVDGEDSVVGRTFQVNKLLNVYTDDEGESRIIAAAALKSMVDEVQGAGSASDDIEELINQVGVELVDTEWSLSVVRKDGSEYNDYYFNDLVEESDD